MKTGFPYRYILELPTFGYGCLVGLNIKEGMRQRQGALMSNHRLISQHWHNAGKLTVPGSSNLNSTAQIFVLKRWKKNVTFCLLKLKVKEKGNFFKIIGGRVTFPWRSLVSSFKVNVYSLSSLMKPQQWDSGNVKQEIITRNCTYELPHELPNNLGLKILGNEELVKLFTWVFTDLMILKLVDLNS